MAETITTKAPKAKALEASGMSPLQAAIAYGGPAAVLSGPLGLVIGGIAAITAGRMRKNELDYKASRLASDEHDHESYLEHLARLEETATPAELNKLASARRLAENGMYRIQSGDSSGRELLAKAESISAEIENEKISDENQEQGFQRQLVGSAAQGLRNEFQQSVTTAEQIDQQAKRIMALVADPDFDPNKPSNKAALAELMSTGIGGMYRDAPDMLDAVTQGSSALEKIPVIGQYAPDLIGAVATAIKSKDFTMTAEDYNRFAINMSDYSKNHSMRQMQRFGEQAQQLDAFAKRTGAIPQDYSLRDYISGGQKELKLLPMPQQRQTIEPRSTPTRILQEVKQWALPGQRPTN